MNWAMLIASVGAALAAAFEPNTRALADAHPAISSIIIALLGVLNAATRSIIPAPKP